MAMTLEQEAMEILAQEYERLSQPDGSYPSYAKLAREGNGAFTMCSIRAVMRALELSRAHLTQPAQAVDVGAIREVIAEIESLPKSEENRWLADKLTRALAGEKAVDVVAMIEALRIADGCIREICHERNVPLPNTTLDRIARALPASPTPNKEG